MTSVIKTPSVPKRPRRGTLRRMLRNPLGIISLSMLTIIVLAAVFAPLIAPFDPAYADVGNTLADPGGQNLLGTDSNGRDVFSRLVYGARLTLLSALLCAAVAIAIGLPAGLIAGFYGGAFDSTSNWFSNMLMALPAIIILLSVRAALGPSTWYAMIAFGILISPAYFRLTRTAVQSVRNELYVDAARVVGLSDARIISRHVLSVVRAPLIIQTALICGVAIAVQSGLQFLGLGDPTEVSWGAMLSDGFSNIYIQPLLMLWPALAIGITIGTLVLLGNAIRDALEDRREIKAPRRPAAQTPLPAEEPAAVDDSEAILQVAGLSVGYPNADGEYTRVVRDVSLTIRPGEVLGLVGESGSGKSQTAFSILGLLPRTARILSGSIRFEESVLVRDGEVDTKAVLGVRGRRIGYIPQEPMSNLDPAFTIGHQLTRPMVKLLGISKKEAGERARNLLEKVGIADPDRVMKGYAHEISGGMAQRVLIAGALTCEPDLIVADEPTTALDVTVQAEVLDVLRKMQQELGVAVLLVTHNIGVIADIADRVAVMRQGEIVETGPVEEILENPSHPYTRSLMASMLVGKTPLTTLGLSGPSMGGEASYGEDVNELALDQADMQQSLSSAAETMLRGHLMGDLLEVRDLVVEYKAKKLRAKPLRALHGVSLSVAEGRTLGLVGESGSGKTTIGRAILGLAPIASGTIAFESQDITVISRRDRRKFSGDLQVIFQDPYTSLNPAMDVGDILAEPLGVQGVARDAARKRVVTLLDRVGLPSNAIDRQPYEFSGGQRQRIAIARALALDPKLIVCDEPVSALDLTTQARVLDLLLEIQQDTGVAYLFISHDLDVVHHVSHDVAVLYKGQIVEDGPAAEVTRTPQHPYTQQLLLASPVPNAAEQRARREQRLALKAAPDAA